MFYRTFRAITALALRLFFRLEAPVDPVGGLALDGAVIYVANHPNGLVDPALVFALAQRPITFLAKAPLFQLPVLGWILKAMGALPVYRLKDGDNPAQNEGTLSAAVDALVAGRAITLFPEGKSHSEPQLAELKTGAARMALEATRRGAEVRIIPVGLTYEAKSLFKSRVHLEVGPALHARGFLEGEGQDPRDAARRLTAAIADALWTLTLNLDRWEDLPIVETAEALYALAQDDDAGNPERQRAFAWGMRLLREEEPARFEQLKRDLASYRRRLELVRVSPRELTYRYHASTVALFVARNLAWLVGLPLFLAGLALFWLPYQVPHGLATARQDDLDVESTVKLLAAMVVAPLWWAALTVAAGWWGGRWLGLAVWATVPALALYTRWYFERRSSALHDARVFFLLGRRGPLKAALLAEGQALAREIDRLAAELKPRLEREARAATT
jgi:1-acyl-sn-glycerol-3-phosphate acyltransferase